MTDPADPIPGDDDYEVDEEEPITAFYSQDKMARVNMPFSCDCSGLVWWSYNQLGLADVMFPSSEAGVKEQVEWFEATHWRAADLLLRWNHNDPSGPFTTRAARLTLNEDGFLQEGDLLYRVNSPTGEGDHVSFFSEWAGPDIRVYDAHSLSTPAVGYRTIGYNAFVDSYTHVFRPKPVGYLMSYRYSASIPRTV